MGLAASQARMLMLFARKSDLEYRGQQISQRRLFISTQSCDLSRTLADKFANTIQDWDLADGIYLNGVLLVEGDEVYTGGNNSNFIEDYLDSQGLHVFDENGKQVTDPEKLKNFWEKIQSGEWTILDNWDGTGNVVDWKNDPRFSAKGGERRYTEDDAIAQHEYDYQASLLQTEDKRLEMELKDVETQHTAVQTEIDSVKKVIDKNIEMSFKTFG